MPRSFLRWWSSSTGEAMPCRSTKHLGQRRALTIIECCCAMSCLREVRPEDFAQKLPSELWQLILSLQPGGNDRSVLRGLSLLTRMSTLQVAREAYRRPAAPAGENPWPRCVTGIAATPNACYRHTPMKMTAFS